ncbi:putative transmembrane protein [Pseudohaliea rubra DSM 19751]|uniref:Putative transmembrane protein n=1 Tax=Pseudohaliea rubra DSM 19751 TaxID=1265313 RepID=A0A095X2A3_9GAMM|nr:hypothetical protein [Pseudohaliea rubra]KGE05004.1 putative transmembrane protein [Pseudohaliea rubra DSM 19751]
MSERGAAGYRAFLFLLAGFAAAMSVAGPASAGDWREVPLPPGFQVIVNELEGPVFADAEGRTLYEWPQHVLRNGYSGEAPGIPGCYGEPTTVTAGLMSPYPAGIPLPERDRRPACTALWPPVLASEQAEPVGDWSVLERRDGSRQWAYQEQPLYTSVRDRRPGDVLGGTRRRYRRDDPAYRVPVGPPPALPPGFAVKATSVGRMLTTASNDALYAFAEDTADSTACRGDCLQRWAPATAPALAAAQGDWSLLERSPGVRQWVFRGKPLYTHRLDRHSWSRQGSDVPGWSNVFLQPAPAVPASFTVQSTLAGNVLADSAGRTIYVYQCADDSQDQLACDHSDDTQVYRLAICGAGDPQRCLAHWPYVRAAAGEESPNRTWTIVAIDPLSGRFAAEDDPGALRVWAYRDRPVYTFERDKQPGDVHGGGIGEWRGMRNGLRAFWLRDDYMQGIL